MTACPSCGRELVPGKKFCKYCGVTVVVEAAPPPPPVAAGAFVCPACGYVAPRPTRFCLKCGAKLAEAQPAAGPQAPTHVGPTLGGAEPTPAGAAAVPALVEARPAPPAADAPQARAVAPAPSAAPFPTAGPSLPLPLPVLVGLGVVLLAAVGFAVWWWASPTQQLVRQVEAAIQRGELVKAEPPDAYFYFTELKNRSPSSGALTAIGQRVLPMLKSKGEELLAQQLKPQPGNPGSEPWKLGARIYQWAHEIDPQDGSLEARLFYCRGQDLRQKNDRSAAAQALLDAVRLDPTWAPSYNSLGLLNTELKNYGAAIAYFQKAISLNPQWAFPYNNMGTAYYLSENYVEAERFYRQAATLDPQWARPRSWLGSVYEKLGRIDEAIAEYEASIQLDPYGNTGINPAQIRNRITRLRRGR